MTYALLILSTCIEDERITSFTNILTKKGYLSEKRQVRKKYLQKQQSLNNRQHYSNKIENNVEKRRNLHGIKLLTC